MTGPVTVPATRTLAEGASSPGATVAVTDTAGSPGLGAVVLSRVDAATIEIVADRTVRRIPDTTAVTDIADPDRRLILVAEAVFTLDRARRELAGRQLEQRDRHARTLGQIRAVAIAHHQDGRYCLDGLNEFLRTFDLPEHDDRIRVRYTIHGSYDTRATDIDAARADARYLGVDLSAVSHLVDDTSDVTLEIDSVDALTG